MISSRISHAQQSNGMINLHKLLIDSTGSCLVLLKTNLDNIDGRFNLTAHETTRNQILVRGKNKKMKNKEKFHLI